MPRPRLTYAKAGVDVNHVREAHKLLARRLESTFQARKGRVGRPVFPIGHYAGLVDLGDGRVLSLHTDSVGTKVLIARMMRRYDTVGIDCVAMCANDLVCTGAEPISFLDYMAVSKPNRALVEEVAIGLAKGAKEAGMAIIGGETAVVPELLAGNGGFDLVGMAAGICRRKDLILGNRVANGDILVGVASSGIHANGLTLARKILLRNHNLKEKIPTLDRTLGEELLEPTRIYVKPARELSTKVDVHGLSHITGGGAFAKLERIVGQARLGASLDQLPSPPSIFQLIQKEGRLPDSEMYRTFNMGIGFVAICPAKEAKHAMSIFGKFRQKAVQIGRVVKREGVWIENTRIG